ncbi:MAG: hypothetical protein K9J80_09570, partial [Sulfuritalea sp.]|nr:hypothetical protein [Sulfuritalea sp.]
GTAGESRRQQTRSSKKARNYTRRLMGRLLVTARALPRLRLYVRRVRLGLNQETYKENAMYLSLQDCIDMSDLSEDEILAIGEHEHLPELLAVELGSYLVHTPGGEKRIKRMIQDDIKSAQAKGDKKRSALLKKVLKHYLEHHAAAV